MQETRAVTAHYKSWWKWQINTNTGIVNGSKFRRSLPSDGEIQDYLLSLVFGTRIWWGKWPRYFVVSLRPYKQMPDIASNTLLYFELDPRIILDHRLIFSVASLAPSLLFPSFYPFVCKASYTQHCLCRMCNACGLKERPQEYKQFWFTKSFPNGVPF